MNILITGANGQLDNGMRALSAENGQHTYFFTDVQELDICDEQAIHALVSGNRVDVIVNRTAYAAVDKAEDNPELRDRLNHIAPGYLTAAAEAYDAAMIQASTSYALGGTGYIPYTEDITPCPNSVCDSTELAGEQAIGEKYSHTMIICAAWLYSIYDNNFVETMIHLGSEREKLGAVFDQVGTPTYASDLARAIFATINQGIVPGVYHFSNEDVCSWCDSTVATHHTAGITSCKVSPPRTDGYPTKASRPQYFVLNKTKIKKAFGIEILHWEENLQTCVDKPAQQVGRYFLEYYIYLYIRQVTTR